MQGGVIVNRSINVTTVFLSRWCCYNFITINSSSTDVICYNAICLCLARTIQVYGTKMWAIGRLLLYPAILLYPNWPHTASPLQPSTSSWSCVLQLPSPPTAKATSVIYGMLFTNTVCGVRKEFADEQQPLMATVVLWRHSMSYTVCDVTSWQRALWRHLCLIGGDWSSTKQKQNKAKSPVFRYWTLAWL